MELNKIYCGDCLEVMKDIDDNSIDLTVTSPPYDNLRTYNGFTWDFEGIAKELYRITKDGGVVVWVVGDATINGSETGTSLRQALYFLKLGFRLHDTMIYQKPSSPFPGKNRYMQVWEYMFIFSKGTPKTINIICDRKNKNSGKVYNNTIRNKNGTLKKQKSNPVKDYGERFNVWLIPNGEKIQGHPAKFPEKLAEDHILSWSNEGDIVFDPFMGSGTTAKMAKLNNRKFLGCEISQEYVDIANKRLETTTTSLF